MGSVVSDIYTFLWDILFKMRMPIRAIVIVIFIVLIVKFIFIPVAPHIIRVLFFVLCKIISLIIRIILYIIYNLLIRPSRACFGKLLSPISMLENGFYALLESVEKVVKNNNKIPDMFYKNKRKINKYTFIILLLTCLWIALPFTKILNGTRIEKYSFIAENKYYAFEHGITDGIGIHPDKKAKNTGKSVAVSAVKEIYFKLNAKGYDGSYIHDKPNLYNSKEITVVKGNVVLLYLNAKSTSSDGRVWYKIKTPDSKIGWISGKLVKGK